MPLSREDVGYNLRPVLYINFERFYLGDRFRYRDEKENSTESSFQRHIFLYGFE